MIDNRVIRFKDCSSTSSESCSLKTLNEVSQWTFRPSVWLLIVPRSILTFIRWFLSPALCPKIPSFEPINLFRFSTLNVGWWSSVPSVCVSVLSSFFSVFILISLKNVAQESTPSFRSLIEKLEIFFYDRQDNV